MSILLKFELTNHIIKQIEPREKHKITVVKKGF